MNVKELRKRAAELNITGRSTMDKPQLENAITVAEAELEAKVGHILKTPITPTVEEAHAMVETFNETYPRAAHHVRTVTRDINALTSMRYGMRGRGMGAKHYRPSLVYTNGGPVAKHYRPKPLGSKPDAHKPLSYGDRVRHYAKQNGQPTLTADTFPGAMLTPAQWRRAQHKQNKNRAFGTKASRYAA